MSDDGDDWALRILLDKYIVLKELGEGSYSIVWLAYNVSVKKYFAVKISKSRMYKPCLHESKVYEALSGSTCESLMSLVESFDIFKDGKVYRCNVMELMKCSLYDCIKVVREKGCGLSVGFIIGCVRQLLEGLIELHKRKIICGDMKPENILIAGHRKKVAELIGRLNLGKIVKGKVLPKNDDKREKILDDIEKLLDKFDPVEASVESCSDYHSFGDDDTDSDLLSVGTMAETESDVSSVGSADCGDDDCIKITDMGGCILESQKPRTYIQTSYYMTPETLLCLPYDYSSDMWVLGCIVYEMITGRVLFDPTVYVGGNESRYHLYLITQRLGEIPVEMIKKSKHKDIFYTCDMKKIKGFKRIDNGNLLKEMNDWDKINAPLITLIKLCLKCNPTERISPEQALDLLKW